MLHLYRLKHLSIVPLVLFVMAAWSGPTHAEGPFQGASDEGSWLEKAGRQAAEWNVMLGAGVRVGPKFEGAKDFEIMPVPMISADFGQYVSVNPSGLTINAWQYEGLSVQGRLGYDLGRDSDDDKHLDGLGDIGASAVLGIDLSYDLMPFEFKLSFDQNLGGSDGFTAEFGTALRVPVEPFMFSIGSSITWADGNYMESYFGVTEKQSIKSGLREFEAEAGFKRFDLEVSGLYFITDHWTVHGEIGLGYLVGDAADSPVSQENLQPYTMFILGYKF